MYDESWKYETYQNVVNNYKSFFLKYYYHSIVDRNLIKLDLMLQHGILSEYRQMENSISCLYTEARDTAQCANGSDKISISYFDGIDNLLRFFSGFAAHVMNRPSILLNKGSIETIKPKTNSAAFDDELFVKDKIDINSFEGILLPNHLLNLKMSDIKPMFKNIRYSSLEYITNWVLMVECYFKTNIDKEYTLNLSKQLFEIYVKETDCRPSAIKEALNIQQERCGINIEEYMRNVIGNLWDMKLNQKAVTYLDVVDYINKDKYPIYVLDEARVRKIK